MLFAWLQLFWKRVVGLWRQVARTASLGERGERAAERYLKRLGYVIVERRARVRWGEIDLVALDGRTVVFVEVKTRRSNEAGAPVEAVDSAKQRRLVRLALAWLKRRGMLNHAARFDILALTWPRGARRPEIVHYRNAFEPTGRGQMFC